MIHLVDRILWAAQGNRRSTLQRADRDKPAPAIGDECEKEVAAGRIQVLDGPVPAAVASLRAERNTEATGASATAGRLDLNTSEPTLHFGDEVVVRAVEQGDENIRTLAGEPFDRGGLPDVSWRRL